MLRLGTLEITDEIPVAVAVPPALITRALGDLAFGRTGGGAAGFAIENLCAALLEETPRAAQACVDRLLDCGVSVDAIYDAYIPRAASRLGDMWADDTVGFSAVTMGMSRLTEVFRRLSPAFLRQPVAAEERRDGGRALFALAAGETHALGVVMAADYFQRCGWSVRVELKAGEGDLLHTVRHQPFDLIGLSAGSRRMIPDLRRTIARLRDVARPSTRFVLGGPLAALDPTIAEQVGVDAAVGAAQAAVGALERGVCDLAEADRSRDRLRLPA